MIKTITAEVDIDLEDYLEEFDDLELITELRDRGYTVLENEEHVSKTIEADIRGCKIKANGETFEFDGLTTIVVYDK
ncbi:hypothetical protein [Anaerosinus massiliensis]|uniref:hypothetical protein n=1 Tax=Massilibacillus massiliensis TaxID=1806837 RepID=UPI000DA6251E|nr:hypothetical protein [Massilibacillus massiliensis]